MEAKDIWTMLDSHSEGVVSIAEFVDAMTLLKGAARNIDMHRVTKILEYVVQLL